MSDGLIRWPDLGTPHGFETRHGNLENTFTQPIRRVRQVHGNIVHFLDAAADTSPHTAASIEERPPGDALVTSASSLPLGVATADCVPVLLHDPVTRCIGAVHAGWRGIAARIVPAALEVMATHCGSRAVDCRAAIGPCVGRGVYRVGPDVLEGFASAGLPPSVFDAHAVDDTGRETALCDLAAAARWQLQTAGLVPDAVWVADRCTATEESRFHSYRRDGSAAGRMTAAIMLD
ncbi:MAG: peptidoglycan editing factor PgeF [Acidobacteria bacterium]|nr:peptidoglycan editing factor PgeF [Acidobacteriota bacterium]